MSAVEQFGLGDREYAFDIVPALLLGGCLSLRSVVDDTTYGALNVGYAELLCDALCENVGLVVLA